MHLQIVEAKIVSGNAVSLNHESSAAYRLSYSVEWSPTSDKFESRFEKYLDSEFFEHKVRESKWLTIILQTADSLGFHFELLHDGPFPYRYGGCDFAKDTSQRFVTLW